MSDSQTKRFKPLSPFFKTELTAVLKRDDRFLNMPLHKGTELCVCLGAECYTYLAIGNECHWELVRVEVIQGRLYISGRGLENTDCREWPCGTCVEFHFTAASMLDLRDNHWAEDKKGDNKNECADEKPERYNGIIKQGIWNLVVKDGVIVDCKRSKRNLPTNDVTRNTVLCWDEDGCITQAGGGKQPLPTINCDKPREK